MKKKIIKKIASYSAVAGATLGANSASADIVYTDIDPDTTLGNQDIFKLDLNNDGIMDFRFFAQSGTWSTGLFGTQRLGVLNSDASIVGGGAYASLLNTGSLIDSGNAFFQPSISSTAIGHWWAYSTGSGYFGGSSAGFWNNQTDKYLGFSVSVAGNTYYGWARLTVNQNYFGMTIKDYAYNSIAGQSILAGQMPSYADISTNVVLADTADNLNPSDLRITFSAAADESTISEYRAFVIKTSNLPALNIDSAKNVTNCDTIIPTGNSSYSFGLPANATDIDGDSIVPGVSYTAVVLSMPDGTNATNPAMSFSDSLRMSYTAIPVESVSNLSVVDISNHLNPTDMLVSFEVPANDTEKISEYRIFVVPSNISSSFNLNTAEANTRYATLVANGSAKNQVLPVTMRDSEGNSIEQNMPYKVFVLSVSNKNSPPYDLNSLSSPSEEIILTSTLGINVNNEVGHNFDVYVEGNSLVINNLPQIPATQIQLFSINGQQLQVVELANDQKEVSLPKPSQRGVYLISIGDGENRFLTKKVIF